LVSLLPCWNKARYLMWGIQVPKKRTNRFFFNILLKNTKKIFARDHETVDELKSYGYATVEFFMDSSYFAYNRKKIYGTPEKKYIVVNINKNAEQFLPEIIQEVRRLYNQWYEVMYVPIAKGKGEQYNDLRYARKIQIGAEIKDQRFSI
jgi:polysaccharide pyruvyl transferase WcaK-like protein